MYKRVDIDIRGQIWQERVRLVIKSLNSLIVLGLTVLFCISAYIMPNIILITAAILNIGLYLLQLRVIIKILLIIDTLSQSKNARPNDVCCGIEVEDGNLHFLRGTKLADSIELKSITRVSYSENEGTWSIIISSKQSTFSGWLFSISKDSNFVDFINSFEGIEGCRVISFD